MCRGAQSRHRGIQPLAALKRSCCFASARSCQTLRRELGSSVGDPGKHKPAMPDPPASTSSTATAFLVAGCKRDIPLLAALLCGQPPARPAWSRGCGAGGSGLLRGELGEAGDRPGPPQHELSLKPQDPHAPSWQLIPCNALSWGQEHQSGFSTAGQAFCS